MPLSLALLACLGAIDPAPGLARTTSWSRDLDCERVTSVTGSRRYPGEIAPPRPRDDVGSSTVVCRERLTRPGLREPRDEAILSELEVTTVGLAETAASLRPDLEDRTWLVEAYDASPPVAAKIAFASKNALMRRGLAVSDRAPILSAGDVDVLTRMSPDEAYPAACRRYFDTGSLGDADALLAVVRRDLRETTLHAGLCASGQWTWLR
jgi:hypothetical protein